MKRLLSHNDIRICSREIAVQLDKIFSTRVPKVFAIPRGGIPAAYAVASYTEIELVEAPHLADVFIDNIIDSGKTRDKYNTKYPGIPFLALIDKTKNDYNSLWIVFPWENDDQEGDITDNIVRLLEFVGEDPNREGLSETPMRVAKAWGAWCSGYGQNVEEVFKVFEDGGESYDEMVVVRDIPFYSHCEHHMAPFFGTATIAYIPDGRIVGLSKLSRLLDVYAKRLQVQERLTGQIADAIMKNLKAKGCGVVIKARHMCMESRGVCKQGHHTVTSALRGVIKDEHDTRAEFLSLAHQ